MNCDRLIEKHRKIIKLEAVYDRKRRAQGNTPELVVWLLITRPVSWVEHIWRKR